MLNDMTSSETMDRLTCGDVGFGKTEVALRAAHVAVYGGRQVALLVPTTLLAQQHYQRSATVSPTGLCASLLSRFEAKQTKTPIGALADGSVDIVIGTHKLLQPDIQFKQLGLVIVDEEHRFGVRHKERLKALRANVDMLTLTATPIPRTLNMAFPACVISLIATPPERRLAVKTFVREWDNASIREACIRNTRGGPICFVHNRVEDIEKIARELEELVEASVAVAHGQMRERQLEQVMLDFTTGALIRCFAQPSSRRASTCPRPIPSLSIGLIDSGSRNSISSAAASDAHIVHTPIWLCRLAVH